MRGIKSIEEFYRVINKEEKYGAEIVVYLTKYNLNKKKEQDPNFHLHSLELEIAETTFTGIFDIMLKYHEMVDEMRDMFGGFSLAYYLEMFDISIGKRGKTFHIFKDFIEEYEWAPEVIKKSIDKFDSSNIWFPDMEEDQRKFYSRTFIYYINNPVSVKQVNDMFNMYKLYLMKEVFSHIKYDIIIDLQIKVDELVRNQMLEHLDLRMKHYSGEVNLDNIRKYQEEMFKQSKKDPEE